MKKKLILLCLIILGVFYACKDDQESERYLNNKIIEGEWLCKIGKDSLVYKFKDGKVVSDFYAFINGLDTLKYEGRVNHGNYLLTDTLILLPSAATENLTWRYRLADNGDSLYLKVYADPTFWREFKRIK